MKITKATDLYEAWLQDHLNLVPGDISQKHAAMAHSKFEFFRATFYRWTQRWSKVCPELADAPEVVAVGDIHVENFGTWRDKEGRLVWGINDFDEAYPLPYTNDLLRLAVSFLIARGDAKIKLSFSAGVQALLHGYRTALASDGRPFVLSRKSSALLDMVRDRLDQPDKFWTDLREDAAPEKPPKAVRRLLEDALPRKADGLKFYHRTGGLGSRGRQRFVVVAHWRGAPVVREAKARARSACAWVVGSQHRDEDFQAWLLGKSVRSPDPSVHVTRHWLVRRLSPDCRRIDLGELSRKRDERELLQSMGAELANVHLACRRTAEILKHFDKVLQIKQFESACRDLDRDVSEDRRDWRQNYFSRP